MRFRPVMKMLIVLAAVLSTAARDAAACSCNGDAGPTCQNAFQVDAVFTARVVALTPIVRDEAPSSDGVVRQTREVRVDFTDVETFRGPRTPVTSVVTAANGAACGYSFRQGERYVVYARRSANGAGLEVTICSRTRPLAEAGDDLRFLRALDARAPAQARVSGTITHWERDLASGAPIEVGPVPDILVTLHGSSSDFHGTTDARGRYDVLVPPGHYEIRPSPPAPFAAFLYPRSITLPDPRACFVADFGIQFDGRIRGSVRLASGQPAANAFVQVMAADDVGKSGNIQTLRAMSDSSGRFEFADVSPGRYVVGVDLTRRMDAEIVFPPTFLPGTADATTATVVELNGGEQKELDPIVLPAPRRSYRLTGIVVFADGTAASTATVSLSDGAAKWRQVAGGIGTESDGTFSFLVHEGLSYIANASYWDEVQGRSFGTTVGPFVVGPATGPLRVVLQRRETVGN